MPLSISDRPISRRFLNMARFPLKMHIFPTRSIQPQIWKCSPCTVSRKFCTRKASTQG